MFSDDETERYEGERRDAAHKAWGSRHICLG